MIGLSWIILAGLITLEILALLLCHTREHTTPFEWIEHLVLAANQQHACAPGAIMSIGDLVRRCSAVMLWGQMEEELLDITFANNLIAVLGLEI